MKLPLYIILSLAILQCQCSSSSSNTKNNNSHNSLSSNNTHRYSSTSSNKPSITSSHSNKSSNSTSLSTSVQGNWSNRSRSHDLMFESTGKGTYTYTSVKKGQNYHHIKDFNWSQTGNTIKINFWNLTINRDKLVVIQKPISESKTVQIFGNTLTMDGVTFVKR